MVRIVYILPWIVYIEVKMYNVYYFVKQVSVSIIIVKYCREYWIIHKLDHIVSFVDFILELRRTILELYCLWYIQKPFMYKSSNAYENHFIVQSNYTFTYESYLLGIWHQTLISCEIFNTTIKIIRLVTVFCENSVVFLFVQ